jgi:hypothetical protein
MRGVLAGLMVLMLLMQFGCQSFRNGLARAFPDHKGYDNGTDDTSDPWIAEAGVEGRSEFKTEKEADPFGWRPLLMSQKARDIEKNLGIE